MDLLPLPVSLLSPPVNKLDSLDECGLTERTYSPQIKKEKRKKEKVLNPNVQTAHGAVPQADFLQTSGESA